MVMDILEGFYCFVVLDFLDQNGWIVVLYYYQIVFREDVNYLVVNCFIFCQVNVVDLVFDYFYLYVCYGNG